ncbi:MAG: TspO/MBR family protein [Candidatus Hadarchaeum sp.]
MKGGLVLNLLLLIVCILICEFTGIIGSIFTRRSISSWYRGLKKPSFNPPNWIFAPAWFILYLLMGVSLYLLLQSETNFWTSASTIIFGLQLFLNALWSAVFFGRRSLKGGLITIFALLTAIVLTIVLFFQVSSTAGIMLLPYLIWTSFATLLNYRLLKLNQSLAH